MIAAGDLWDRRSAMRLAEEHRHPHRLVIVPPCGDLLSEREQPQRVSALRIADRVSGSGSNAGEAERLCEVEIAQRYDLDRVKNEKISG